MIDPAALERVAMGKLGYGYTESYTAAVLTVLEAWLLGEEDPNV